MYSLAELNEMEEQKLRDLAEGMGIKKASSMPRTDLEYAIIDQSAETSAREEAAKIGEQKPRRRGRPRKERNPEDNSQEKNDLPAATNSDPEGVQPKRRGRKPKALKEAEAAAAAAQTTLPMLAPEGNQGEKAADASPAEPVQQKKRRGRKPKALKEAEAAAAAAQAGQAIETPVATEATETPAQKAPAQQQAPMNVYSPKSIDSFFNSMKGRTFTPRTQEQIEEQARNPQPVQQAPAQPQIQQPQTQQSAPQPMLMPQQGQMQPGQKLSKRQRQLLRQQQKRQEPLYNFAGIVVATGVLEVMPDGYGFLRSSDYNYLTSPDDVYVPLQMIKQFGLKTGDVVEGEILPPREGEKFFPLCRILAVNGLAPELARDRVPFEHLTPLFPDEKFELTKGKTGNISMRVVDMFAPIGKGQRALIVAPPKTGKTILLKDIANAISENHPDTYIIMLLIDERPEEVTDMARSVNAEVVASTFDEPAERHVKIAGIVLEKAKRLVESGHDVVIMLDSITRLARAYNTVSPASGKILSGGVDANALQRPKRFFGAARNIENGGSLTIIATALTETSSKMDEVIFEEFKGTGNMELQLDRKLSNKRIFPAVDIVASSTRRDDLLLPGETLNRMWVLRNFLGDMNSMEAMDFIKKRMEMTRTNEELLVTMDK